MNNNFEELILFWRKEFGIISLPLYSLVPRAIVIPPQFQGEVETETITEYREVTDDADFGSFGNFEAQKELAKGRLLGKLTGSDSGTKAKAKASSSGMSVLSIVCF